MTRVATYVFIDLETTGLPPEECNKTKITELSMVAVKRDHLLDTRPGSVPRVQHKLTLCFNPRKRISCIGTETTGLCNYLLENEPAFTLDVFNMINTFLNVLSKPVCLIAQNGLGFDFPILKNHLVKLNVSFSEDLLCADCYHAFYDILENKKQDFKVFIEDTKLTDVNPGQMSLVSEVDSSTRLNSPSHEANSPSNAVNSTTNGTKSPSYDESPFTTKTSIDDFYTSNIEMQAINETTPKRRKTAPIMTNILKVRRRMPWGSGPKPAVSYKLKDIYERVLKRAPTLDPHRAEHDCILALEISAALSKQFVDWVDENHVTFTEIVPMTIGIRL